MQPWAVTLPKPLLSGTVHTGLLQPGWELTHPEMNYDIIHTCQPNLYLMKINTGCNLVVITTL